jgi:SAM-dependent methyltransferase
VLTINFDRFPTAEGNRVLDFGCGDGRHAFEVYRRGADVVALDLDDTALKNVQGMFEAMADVGEAPSHATARAVRGDGATLPFPDGAFDRIIAAEVLEHLPDDAAIFDELVRVLAPGGLMAITVPRWFPERVCWALSTPYHEVEGGHVRIYRRSTLTELVRRAGLRVIGSHHAHAFHSPWWWLKCLVGVDNETRLVKAYHDTLVWEMKRNHPLTRLAERALNPLLGKSFVLYAVKN